MRKWKEGRSLADQAGVGPGDQGTSGRELVLLVLPKAGAQGPGAERQLLPLPVTVRTSCWGLHSAVLAPGCGSHV